MTVYKGKMKFVGTSARKKPAQPKGTDFSEVVRKDSVKPK